MEKTHIRSVAEIGAKIGILNGHHSRSGEVQSSTSVPSLVFNDASFSLAATAPHISLAPPPRLPVPQYTVRSKPRRPLTASTAEEKLAMLPSSTSSPGDLAIPTIAMSSPSSQDGDGGSMRDRDSASPEQTSIQEVNRRAHAAVAGLRAEASRLAGAVDMLPSPFDPSPTDEHLAQGLRDSSDPQVDYDWATFINAYALGRWDPLKTPHPPRSHLQAPSHSQASRMTPRTTDVLDFCDSPEMSSPSSLWESNFLEHASAQRSSSSMASVSPSPATNSAPPQYHVPNALPNPTGGPAVPTLPEAGIASRRSTIPLNLGFPHRLRNSFADMRSSSSHGNASDRPHNLSNADVTTTAAAIRLAAARVSVAPLALPSPEHELTDPMRGVTATIPGSHPPNVVDNMLPKSPNASRKSRLSSFWQGTQDVGEYRLPTIEASPPEVPPEQPTSPVSESRLPSRRVHFASGAVPPATAPVRVTEEKEDEDYFGTAEGGRMADSFASLSDTQSSSTTSISRTDHDISRQSSAPPFDHEPATVPALPRRICLTRQTSAPLPTLALYERRLQSPRPVAENSALSHVSRSAKEEQMFSELGYLAPPNPPDELERRRALYKFNIWNTGHDMNFDRIAHLVKLVFSTRIVYISLVDGTEEFFKSESGFGCQTMPRSSSFDAHAILQRDDEPMIILDALEDWRFARNPLVTGYPHVRFYAGCPLRSQDGHNIGTLSIIDDSPRREFSPRQRHTLKEFAQIAMRELELWRDKIQLRIRDRIQNSMEQFTRECLEVDKDVSGDKQGQGLFVGTSMEQVYERAARLVKRTLDVEGAIVMDVSHVDVVETLAAESTTSITLHSDDPQVGTVNRTLNADECSKLQDFFNKSPDGKICEGVLPSGLRPFLPSQIQYALVVPIFNIDKRPFAILCAYSTGEKTTPFLEGHELSYLRAIGVIILSAVLKRRMILADKAKSLFISNISHELRTPLHGILASAELLSDTHLDHSQASFLQTVQACGTSLVETVNHVLDFTKLSGNAKAGGVENVVQRSKVDLMQLVEEATEGCWIGHRARMFTSEIGSVYSPPKQDKTPVLVTQTVKQVETIIDVDHKTNGWVVKCEKGGIRRVLMNIFGNSLKFTSDGYVHVMLRQQPPAPGQPPDQVKIELSVIDTGKGISQGFLKNQLFHPFSQENPLQTGTGLGLAIVNSIVRSSSVDGKVDVWSAEGVGTEIKITFTAELLPDEESHTNDSELLKVYESLQRPRISLIGFDGSHRGVQLLRNVLTTYLLDRWGLSIAEGPDPGDIVIVNEDFAELLHAIETKDISRPIIVLSSTRGNPRLMTIVTDYERLGGFCRVVYKPCGPQRLYSALKLCLHAIKIAKTARNKSVEDLTASTQSLGLESPGDPGSESPLGLGPRRYSEEGRNKKLLTSRPLLGPRAITAHPLSSWSDLVAPSESDESIDDGSQVQSPTSLFPTSPSSPTVAIGTGGTLLKSSVGVLQPKRSIRVLVVEDNALLRNLLSKWLKNKGYDFREAVDGLEGVHTFENDGHFDVVLVDLSMPILDGVGATSRIRAVEAARKQDLSYLVPDARILALTGMSTLEDKRRAFEAGVDGYLVKPVAFKTLDMMFHKLGLS